MISCVIFIIQILTILLRQSLSRTYIIIMFIYKKCLCLVKFGNSVSFSEQSFSCQLLATAVVQISKKMLSFLSKLQVIVHIVANNQ